MTYYETKDKFLSLSYFILSEFLDENRREYSLSIHNAYLDWVKYFWQEDWSALHEECVSAYQEEYFAMIHFLIKDVTERTFDSEEDLVTLSRYERRAVQSAFKFIHECLNDRGTSPVECILHCYEEGDVL